MGSWFSIPQPKIDRIEKIISNIHTASLLLDDVEDNSPLRRGKPAAYRIYGSAQTINSTNYLYVMAVEGVLELGQESQKEFLGMLFTSNLEYNGC